MRAVFTGVLCFWAVTAHAAAVNEFQGIRTLDLRVSAGDISIVGVSGGKTTFEVVKTRYDERCQLKIEQRGDLLFVELASRNLFAARCQANFKFHLPKAVALKIKSGSGDIKMTNMTGSVDVAIGSGDLRGQGLESQASVRTGSGSVRLVYAKVPAQGLLDIRSGSGNAEVLFPPKAKIKTKFVAGSGVLRNKLGESSDARFVVSMKTGSGDLTVGKF